MKHILLYIPVLIFITSCSGGKEEPYTPALTKIIKDINTFDNTLEITLPPDTFEIGKALITKALAPKEIPARHNVILAGKEVEIKKLESPDTHTPGVSEHIPPLITSANHNKIQSGIPDIIEAKSAYSKERNPFSFQFYTRLQGLTHDDISSIIQDSNGNIWIGSYFSGATRFDGKNFAHYSTAEGLGVDRIISIYEDRDGNIWFGTVGGGVSKYDGRYFTNYTEKDGLPTDRIEAIFQDSDNNLWFGTYGGGISVFDGLNFITYSKDQGLAGSIVYSITEDSAGNIWIATWGGGISIFDGTSFNNYNTDHGLGDDYIHAILIDSKGNFWIATDTYGVSKIMHDNDGNKLIRQYHEGHGLSNNSVMSLMEDRYGNIWMGTRGGGISVFDGEYFHHYSYDEGLINDQISTLYEDKSGNIWVGTLGGGIAKYQGDLFYHYTHFEGLPNSNIRALYSDSQNNMWIGSNGGGLFKFNGWAFEQYTEEEGLSENYIRSIIKDNNDNLWIGTSGGGVTMFDGSYFYTYNSENGLSDDFVFSLYKCNEGNIWVGTAGGGICKLIFNENEKLPSKISYFTEDHGLADNNVVDIVQDNKGKFWFATSFGGVSIYDGENFYTFSKDNVLQGSDMTAVIQDSREYIWMAHYDKGVTVFDGQFFINITSREGLLSDYAFSLFEDSKGIIWVGTRYGLSKITAKELDNLITSYKKKVSNTDSQHLTWNIKNYSYENGFLGFGCNPRTIAESENGHIWIGANDILTVYKPSGEPPLSEPPNIKIIAFGVYNEYIDWPAYINNKDTVLQLENGIKLKNVRFDGMESWSNLPQKLEIPYYSNYLTFQFVGITTNFPEKNRYQFMLEGLDDNWSVLRKRTEAHYANLPPGRYTFKVRAVNSEGLWSEEATYSFRISPPFWKTTQAYVFYIILTSFILYVLYKLWQKRKQEKEYAKESAMLLAQEVEIATKSVEFKQNFLANMSHEIRTPLTGILGMAEIISKTELNEAQKEHISTLIHSGENLKEIIDLILDYSKLEAGQVKLKSINFSIESLFHNATNLYKPFCDKKQLQFKTFISQKTPHCIKADRNKVNQIVINLLSNAVKFTDKGEITLKATPDDKTTDSGLHKGKRIVGIRIEVKDTGRGINLKQQDKLFQPFSQIEHDQVRAIEGTGLGLSICKELAKNLGGEIGFKSQEGHGSTFWFTFKAAVVENYTEEDIKPKANNNTNKMLRILFVEDKPVTQKVVNLILTSMGHKVECADNGKDALELFKPGYFDLVLMDIQMPVMDGVTATQKLREDYRELPPIVGLSANAFEGDREKYIGLGLDEYLTKPVKQEDFIKLFEKLGLNE